MPLPSSNLLLRRSLESFYLFSLFLCLTTHKNLHLQFLHLKLHLCKNAQLILNYKNIHVINCTYFYCSMLSFQRLITSLPYLTCDVSLFTFSCTLCLFYITVLLLNFILSTINDNTSTSFTYSHKVVALHSIRTAF